MRGLTLPLRRATSMAMSRIKSICVYCGSGPGTNPAFVQAAHALGKVLAENDIRLVYGGGSVGLMGAVADSVLDQHKKPILLANIERFWDPLCVLLEHMRRIEFIRPGLSVELLLADRVEDILPKLTEAARAVSEAETQMTPVAAERM
jgi:predicted Rossmann-fold nucleotide-binding protein